MIKHCIFACALVMLPQATLLAMNDDLRQMRGRSARQLLIEIADTSSDNEDEFDQYDEGQWEEDQRAYDEYVHQQQLEAEEYRQYLEQQECEAAEQQEEYEDCRQYSDEEDDYGDDEWVDDEDQYSQDEEYSDDGSDWPSDDSVVDEDSFIKNAQLTKRATDRKEDRPYRRVYNEDLRKLPVYEKPSKKEKRIMYARAQQIDFTNKVSRRSAEKFAAERDYSRRHIKMRKAINLCEKRRLKDLARENTVPTQSEANEQSTTTTKTNSWQADAPEVLMEKRLQDAHRQFRAPLVKKGPAVQKIARVRSERPMPKPKVTTCEASQQRISSFRSFDGRWH